MAKEYNCKGCGKEVEWYRSRPKKWCSDKCKNDYHNLQRRKNHIFVERQKINCITCGTLSTNIYCSKDCYPRHTKWLSVQKFKMALSTHYLIIPTNK